MPLYVFCLVLFSAALHATWNGMIKSGADRLLETALVLGGAAVISVAALLWLHLPAAQSVPYLCASATVHIAYFYLVALCYQKGDMSLVYPISRGSAPAMAAITAMMVIGERFSARGWVGCGLISLGVALCAFEKRSGDIHVLPVLLALLNGVMICIYTVIDGAGVRLSHSPLSYTCAGFLLCAVCFVPAVFISRRKAARELAGAFWRRSLAGGACTVTAYALALWAMTKAPIAAVAALRETAILFGVIFSACRLKEPVTPVRVLACLSITLGAVMLKLA